VRVLIPAVRVGKTFLLAPSVEKCPLYILCEFKAGSFRPVEVIEDRGGNPVTLRGVVESKRPDIVVVLDVVEGRELEELGVKVYRSRELEVEKALGELEAKLL